MERFCDQAILLANGCDKFLILKWEKLGTCDFFMILIESLESAERIFKLSAVAALTEEKKPV